MRTLFTFFASETFGFLLKLFSGLAAASFGILGIGSKTREEDGRLTRNGKIALAGILVAGVLAIGTSVYDFTTSQLKARAAQAQVEQLLLSVKRGIYPFRGITASFDFYFDQGISGIPEYKEDLKRKLSQLRDCKKSTALNCQTIDGKPVSYTIPSTSPLFPRTGTVARAIFDNLSVDFLIAKRLSTTANSPIPYRRVGQLNLSLHKHAPDDWLLSYDALTGNAFIEVKSIKIPDAEAVASGACSLVDFIPGFLAAIPDQTSDELCAAIVGRIKDCQSRIIQPLERSLHVAGIALNFNYPKVIYFDSRLIVDCGSQKYLPAFLFNDADTENRLGAGADEVRDKDRADFCKAVNEPTFFTIQR